MIKRQFLTKNMVVLFLEAYHLGIGNLQAIGLAIANVMAITKPPYEDVPSKSILRILQLPALIVKKLGGQKKSLGARVFDLSISALPHISSSPLS